MIKSGRPVTVEADSNTIDAALLYALPDGRYRYLSPGIFRRRFLECICALHRCRRFLWLLCKQVALLNRGQSWGGFNSGVPVYPLAGALLQQGCRGDRQFH